MARGDSERRDCSPGAYGGFRGLLVVGLVACGIGIAAPAAGDPAQLDWCSSLVVRPDQRLRDPATCASVFSDAEIAASADAVYVGDFTDVSQPVIPAPGRTCDPAPSHAANASYVERLRKARAKAGKPPLQIIHMHRFDLVPATYAALPGFDPDFLIEAGEPVSAAERWFAKDRSAACRDGCRWSDSWPAMEGRDDGRRLRDLIDAKGGPGRYERAIYYTAKSGLKKGVFGVTAAEGDQSNPAYRAWRVAEAKRALAVGGYSAIELNHKLHQWRPGADHWLGAKGARDVDALLRTGDAFWSSWPKERGYINYVQGWAALARDLKAAGVPFSVTVSPLLWLQRSSFDDPRTPEDETAILREAAELASFVALDKASGHPSESDLAEVAAGLRAKGAQVVIFDQGCGLRPTR